MRKIENKEEITTIKHFDKTKHIFFCLKCMKEFNDECDVLAKDDGYFCKECNSSLQILVGRVEHDEIFFCPDCRVLFEDEKNIEVVTDGYICKSCTNKSFSIGSYRRKAGNGISYKLSKLHKHQFGWTATKKIREIVKAYYDDGFSYRDIRDITKFSLEKIGKALHSEDLNYQKFQCDRTRLLGLIGVVHQDNYKRKIIKSLEYGCSYKSIEKLFSVSSKTISEVKKEFELENFKIVAKKRVKIEKSGYTVIERKK